MQVVEVVLVGLVEVVVLVGWIVSGAFVGLMQSV